MFLDEVSDSLTGTVSFFTIEIHLKPTIQEILKEIASNEKKHFVTRGCLQHEHSFIGLTWPSSLWL